MKTYQAPMICPVCQDALQINHLSCSHCTTEVKGHFHLSKFNYLNIDTQYFIEIFLKNRGNIKAVEKELNISYPTVKKLLDDAIEKLGYAVETQDTYEETDPLEDLKSGIIDVKEAVDRIKQKYGK
jgi:hypothetical protein